MPKREDDFWANQREGLRYCYKHKRYYRADFGCQLCLLEQPKEDLNTGETPELLDCPKCTHRSLFWNVYTQTYECLNIKCKRIFTEKQLKSRPVSKPCESSLQSQALKKPRKFSGENGHVKYYRDGHAGLCPFCGTSNITRERRDRTWRCNKCMKIFPTPSYGTGDGSTTESHRSGKTAHQLKSESAIVPGWIITFTVVFVLMLGVLVVWLTWGSQISTFLTGLAGNSPPAITAPLPQSPSTETPSTALTPSPVEPTPAPETTKPTATATTPASPVQPSVYQHEELVAYALELINGDRLANGLMPVTLGSNTAAQKHAEERLANKYLSHWGLDGLKPYMRYTLAGGVNSESENGFSTETIWIGGKDPSYRIDPKEILEEAQKGLMASPGHRRNILDKWHQKVNLGIAYDAERLDLVQQFEGDYIEFSVPPVVIGNNLSMIGRVTLGTIESIDLYYDPLPQHLTPEQLDAPPYDYAYGWGEDIGTILPPLPPDIFYIDLLPTDVIAETWDIGSDGLFIIEADISVILSEGNGVYTVVIWVETGGEYVAISNYSLFVR